MKVDSTPEEREAGLSEFEKLGEFNVLYSLAGGDLTKMNDAYQMPYSVAYYTLWRKAMEARFAKRLQKVYYDKADRRR